MKACGKVRSMHWLEHLSNEVMKIIFVDNCSQETYLADVSIRCSNPPPLIRRVRASNRNIGKIGTLAR